MLPQKSRGYEYQESKYEESKYEERYEQEIALPAKSRDMKKKPANPLLKFIPSENTKVESEPVNRQKVNAPSFD